MERLSPNEAGFTAAVEHLRAGRLVIFPTETYYALGAAAFHREGLRAVFQGKARNPAQPVALLAADEEQAFALWSEVRPRARALAARYWPGPLTLVLPGRAGLPEEICSTYGVGVRVSPHRSARELARRLGEPLVATSANPSGGAPTARAADFPAEYLGAAALFCDDEGVLGGLPSTLAALQGEAVLTLRQGPISLEP
jgi:L-threonylcarbamoyladenylate synthase